jgi:AcrR family transcriptional regulator
MMTDTSVRPPKQKRSHESLERVLDASTQLLEEKGFDAFTVQEVSQRADVSVGAIYARFGSKESLLRAVHRHALEALRPDDAAFAVADGRPARDEITNAVAALATVFRANEDLLRAFMHLGAVDDEISKRASDSSKDLARQFEGALLAHRDAITHRDPEKAVDVAFRIAFATFTRRVMSGATFESDRVVDWDELVHEVGSVCAAYLLDDHTPPRARGKRRPA